MGALVAAVNKKGENAVPTVVSMLHALAHRGMDSHGIATSSLTTTVSALEELDKTDINSSIALGHNLSRIMPRDKPQPVQGNGFAAIFEGRLFPSQNLPNWSEVQEFVEKLGSSPLGNASSVIEKMSGSYVFAVIESDKVIAGRDIFGATPLYYGENGSLCAVASERKALWKIGLKDIRSFPPGQQAIINERGFAFHAVKELSAPPKEKMDMETAARALHLLLLEATRKHVSDLDCVAVAFSGGVDSSVVAVLVETIGLDVKLISVGLENQPDVIFAEEAAEALGLPFHLQTYTVNELKETLVKVLWLIEEPHVINTCIAIPFFWLAETATKLGYPVLLAGQGADELFGGYKRYLTEYEMLGADAVEQKMFHDIINAYSANFQRDNQVCSYHGIELRLPFVDRYVVDFSLRLPLRLKIGSVNDGLRKRILRRVAHNMGIPSFLGNKPKKAVQYTTGVTKALQRLAKDNGLTLREYVKKTFEKIS